MELTPDQLREVHAVSTLAITESELPRVVRERDALKKAVEFAVMWLESFSVPPTSTIKEKEEALGILRAALEKCQQKPKRKR